MIEPWIYDVLTGDADVTDLVGERIFPARAIRQAGFPYLVYEGGAFEPSNTLASAATGQAAFTVRCYSLETAGAWELANAVGAALEAQSLASNTAGSVTTGPCLIQGYDQSSLEPIDGSDRFATVVTVAATVWHN